MTNKKDEKSKSSTSEEKSVECKEKKESADIIEGSLEFTDNYLKNATPPWAK